MFYDDPYLEFVNQVAMEKGNYFLLDSGEGRDFEDSKTGWYIEDLSGWIVSQVDHERFINSRRNGTVDDDFKDQYVFAIWAKDESGQLNINFKKY